MHFASKSFALLLATAVCGGIAVGVHATPGSVTVSQKDRKFSPADVTLAKDQTLVIVNDDGDLLHHAYIESETFSFDSGDQKPGSRTAIPFTARGDFKVLCGIHPKMKLTVHVK